MLLFYQEFATFAEGGGDKGVFEIRRSWVVKEHWERGLESTEKI